MLAALLEGLGVASLAGGERLLATLTAPTLAP
jgi:hypothetical protein